MSEELAQRLRDHEQVIDQLRDRIEALTAENERLRAILAEMTPDYEWLVEESWDRGAILSWVEEARSIAAKARAALTGDDT